MSLNDVRLRALQNVSGPLDTSSVLQEIEAEIANAARFPFGPLGEFTLALKSYAKDPMTAKDRSLFRLMTTLSSGCESCIAEALIGVIRRGADRTEIKRALTRGVMMAERPALLYAAEALAHVDAIQVGTSPVQSSTIVRYRPKTEAPGAAA